MKSKIILAVLIAAICTTGIFANSPAAKLAHLNKKETRVEKRIEKNELKKGKRHQKKVIKAKMQKTKIEEKKASIK